MERVSLAVGLAVFLVLTAGCVAPGDGTNGTDGDPVATPSPTPSETTGSSPEPSATPDGSPSQSPSASPSPSPTPSATPAGETHTVEIGKNLKGVAADYAPEPITIQAGDSIVWANRDTIVHTATEDDQEWDTGSIGGGKSSDPIVFETPGTYTYYCKAHPGTMNGAEVIVEE